MNVYVLLDTISSKTIYLVGWGCLKDTCTSGLLCGLLVSFASDRELEEHRGSLGERYSTYTVW